MYSRVLLLKVVVCLFLLFLFCFPLFPVFLLLSCFVLSVYCNKLSGIAVVNGYVVFVCACVCVSIVTSQ